MEYVSKSLKLPRLHEDSCFHPRCENIKITHFCFADDVLLMSKADVKSASIQMDYFFGRFSAASSLKVSPDKLEIIFAGVFQLQDSI